MWAREDLSHGVEYIRQKPDYRSPSSFLLSSVFKRNVEALRRHRLEQAAAASLQERAANAITKFTGSMTFVYLHNIWILESCQSAPDPWRSSLGRVP